MTRILSRIMRAEAGAFLIVTGVFIALGLMPLGESFQALLKAAPDSPFFAIIGLLGMVASLVPLLLGLIVRFTRLRLSWMAGWLTTTAALFVAVLWVLASALGGPAAGFIILKSVAIASSVFAAIRLASAPIAPERRLRFSRFSLLATAALGLWSLLGLAWVIYQTETIASGRPYCLAVQGKSGSVKSFAALRYFSFYTDNSGYKSNSRWYFHGVLLVSDVSGYEAYNWSLRKLDFDSLAHIKRQVIDPNTACMPRLNFLSSLRLY